MSGTAVIYTRVSSEGQIENTSPETQQAACCEKAAALGLSVSGVYFEGLTGELYYTRTKLQAALQEIDAGRASILISYSLDRLSRDVAHQHEIKKRVQRAGGRLVFCFGEYADSAEGDLHFGIDGTFKQYERQVIRRRTFDGSKRMAAKGIQPTRGMRPYGYTLITNADVLTGKAAPGTQGTYVIREDEAEFIRYIFVAYASGASLHSIAKRLNEDRIPTARGGACWRKQTIVAMIENPIYKGQATYGRTERVHDEERMIARGLKTHVYRRNRAEPLFILDAPATVSEALWQRCQDRRAENKEKESGNPKRRFLLSGLARCPLCGRGLAGNTQREHRSYRCNREYSEQCQPQYSYNADPFEHAVFQAILEYASNPESLAGAERAYRELQHAQDKSEDVLAGLWEELAKLDKERDATIQAQIAGIQAGLQPDAYNETFKAQAKRREALEARIQAAEDDQKSRPPVIDSPGITSAPFDPAKALAGLAKVLERRDELPKEELRALLRTVVWKIHPMVGADGRCEGAKVFLLTGSETVQMCSLIWTVSCGFSVLVEDAPEELTA